MGERFRSIDRSVHPTSLQHVAEPAPLGPELIREHSEAEALAWQDPVLAPTDCRGEPLDLGPWCSAAEHGASCVPPCPAAPSDVRIMKDSRGRTMRVAQWDAEVPADIGPATSADLLELDAVPEPVDSDAPPSTYLPGAAPIGPTAQTRPYRRVRHITGPDGVPRPESEDEERMHARTLARARK